MPRDIAKERRKAQLLGRRARLLTQQESVKQGLREVRLQLSALVKRRSRSAS